MTCTRLDFRMAVCRHPLHPFSLCPTPPPRRCVCLSLQVLVCMCVRVHPEDNLGCSFSQAVPFIFETGVSHWPRICQACVTFCDQRTPGSVCLHLPALEIQVCTITPGMFYVDSGNRPQGSSAFKARTFLTKPVPRPSPPSG